MVDLPGPTPLRASAPAQRAQSTPVVHAAPSASSEIEGKSLPQLVALANELASGPPPVDYERVARIRAAISTGSYRIDPGRIAAALIGKSQ